MSFNADPNKQAIEVLFRINAIKKTIRLSNLYLDLILGSKLTFNEHSESKITKCNKIIRLMKKLLLALYRKSLLTT